MSDWERKLSEWTAAGLLTGEQAAAIRDHEKAPEERPVEQEESEVSPAVEAVGYLGGALAVAATFFFLEEVIGDLSEEIQTALIAFLTLVLLVAGGAIRSESPPARRLKSVLWAASTASAAATGAVVTAQLLDTSGEVVAITASTAALLVGAIEWWFHRSALQNVVLLAAAAGAATSLVSLASTDLDIFFYGVVMWAVAATWVVLSWRAILTPSNVGMVAGSAAAVVGAQLAAVDDYRGWGLALGVVTVALVLAMGIRLNLLGLLIVGAISALVFAVQVAAEIFGTELAAAVALMLAGVLLVTGAVVASRRMRRPGKS